MICSILQESNRMRHILVHKPFSAVLALLARHVEDCKGVVCIHLSLLGGIFKVVEDLSIVWTDE